MRIPSKEFLSLKTKLIPPSHESKSNQEKEFGENLENKKKNTQKTKITYNLIIQR